ncbi:hypothetical protein ACF0H5_010721 [Mactra antiquata]
MSLTADQQECVLRGYIPLEDFILKTLQSDTDITEVNFSGNGYVTDTILHLLYEHSKTGKLKNLRNVNLVGCNLVTDYGIRALVKCMKESSQLASAKIVLEGCHKLTDSTFGMVKELHDQSSAFQCSMVGSALYYQGGSDTTTGINTTGCSLINSFDATDVNEGHVLIVPHEKSTTSVGEYLCTGKRNEWQTGYHKTDLDICNWKISLTEVHQSSCLLDNLLAIEHSQVMIPFDANLEPKDIQKHVVTTISRVVAKEPIWKKMLVNNLQLNDTVERQKNDFLDMLNVPGVDFTQTEDGAILKNLGVTEDDIGAFFSKERITRSNSYIEVSVKGNNQGQSGLLLGIMYDLLYEDRNPMSSTSDIGGMVDGFEATKDLVIGFGIEGDWLSEYTPGPSADFYFIENGVKKKSKTNDKNLKPNSSMYPVISVMGKEILTVEINQMVKPPQEVFYHWKSENKWIECGFIHDCMIDRHGRITYLTNYDSMETMSIFLGMHEMHAGQSYSVEVERVPEKFSLGLATEECAVLKNTACTITFTQSSVRDKKDTEPTLNIDMALIKDGDTITIECISIEEKDEKHAYLCKITHNSKEVVTCELKIQKHLKTVPYISVCKETKPILERSVIRLKNYRPSYRRPAPLLNKVTVGRIHYLDVMNDGECTYRNPFSISSVYGWFMAKTPVNKDLLEFSVEVLELSNQKLFGIGLTEPNFDSKNTFIGWKQDTFGYHADNGKYYQNDGTGSDKGVKIGEPCILAGDIVTVKVVPCQGNTLLFDKEGILETRQTILVQFYKNQVLVYEIPHSPIGETVHFAFSTKDSKVKVQNFYPETSAIRREVELSKLPKNEKAVEKEEEKLEKATHDFMGTEFLVLGMAAGSSDPAGKLQIIQQHIDGLQSNWPELNAINESIKDLEKRFSTLDLQEQVRYGEYCGVRDNMIQFQKDIKHRVRYLTISRPDDDSQSQKERDNVLKELEEAENRLKILQPLKYQNCPAAKRFNKTIQEKLSSQKIWKFSTIFETIDVPPYFNGRSLLKHLEMLQSKGKLILLDIGSDVLVADIDYVFSLEGKLRSLKPAELVRVDTVVPYIGSTSHVWLLDTINTNILSDIGDSEKADRGLFLMLLEKCLALIRLHCLRSDPKQEQNVFAIQQNIAAPQKSLVDYWKNNKDLSSFVIMKQTYKFPLSLLDCCLPLILSNTNTYGRIIVLTPRGVVYQNGAVQTVILKQQDSDEIVVESQCYMPDLDSIEDCRLSKLTPSYVQDYVWNIFCIYTDIIDDLLSRAKIIYSVTKDTPKDLVNVSVGCKHTWMRESGHAVVQSVCTLCNKCCDGGDKCDWNNITGEYLRQSGCCSLTSGCQGCGICISCAQELWAIRSRLRPFGNVITSVPMTIAEKNTKVKATDSDQSRQALKDPLMQSIMTLDPYMFNEVEFTDLSGDRKMICLTEESDGTMLQVFPGAAVKLQELKQTGVSNDPDFKLNIGDRIKVRISDPLGAAMMMSEESTDRNKKLQIFPQIFAKLGREMKVIHESAIVVYDTLSDKLPVGQLIGAKPMTRDFDNYSIKILALGEKGTIAMGLGPHNYAPNRQPGWNSQSIGYHADDGGIFLESGSPTRRTLKCQVGDIMSFYIDFARNKGFFRRNGEKVIELNLNFNKLACYPMIGFHSIGEAVQILEKDLWTPKTEQERANNLPPAYTTYEYGNLWISPGDEVTINKLKANEYFTWVILHNPIKDPVGFKVSSDGKNHEPSYGIIEYKKDWLGNLKFLKDGLPSYITVEWASLESGRSYTNDEIKILFRESTDPLHQSSHQHKLTATIADSDTSVEQLAKVKSGIPEKKKFLCLHIYKNMKLVDEYWVKYGNYQVSVETLTKSSVFTLQYPKTQGFTYPRGFQKGMKLYIYLESEQAYAECVVVDVYPGGKNVALEYSPKDRQTSNMTICMMTKSAAFNFTSFNETATILPYESRNTPASLTKTFVTAPPYLLSEGAKMALNKLNPEWKADMLKSFADCSQVLTRVTVQERLIWSAAKSLMSWIPYYNDDWRHFSFLPSQLTEEKLLFPQPTEMFSDISVHRLCFGRNEMMLVETYGSEFSLFEMPINYAIHFADIPGIPPESHVPVDVLFGEAKNVWAYTALIASKLFLPSYKRMIPDHDSKLTRTQIEDLLYSMLQTYTSLCGIYAASWGGTKYAQINDMRPIYKTIKHEDKHLQAPDDENYLNPHILLDNQLGFSVCKAHYMNMCSDEFDENKMEFKYEYFEPYGELVTLFHWSHSKLEKLPEDFFKRFSNLLVFNLGYPGVKMSKFKSLPHGIAEAKKLKNIQVIETAMETLPDDMFMGKELDTVMCVNMPIKKLPTQYPKDSKLQKLALSGLLVKQIPAEMSNLSEIKDLDLCHNPLTSIPDDLKHLVKLTKLSLEGCPWLALEGKRTQMTHTQFQQWCSANPFIAYNLGEKKLEQLFTTYDFNHNGSLDEEEMASFNHELFFNIPRLGITNINDDTFGGIPPVVFLLKSLEELNLEYNAITMVPSAINNLQNLKVLNLGHNPLLESLPGSLGHLPNIQQMHIKSCPMLRTPPTEVVSRGFESVKAYLKRLAGGFTECRRTKLMVVGLGGAGKTSLLRALMSEKKMTQGTEKEIPTDGIDIVPWTVETEDGHQVTYSTWDFAGQAVYYNTHQFFLSKRAVYLLLWSMRQGYEHAGLDFWLSSICCHAPGTPIIVIGTQCDLIPKAEIPMKELKERYPQIASFHQVSAIQGTGIEELQKNLLAVTLQQGYMGEKIPQVWLNFERRIIAERLTKKSYIKWNVARDYAMEQGIYDEKDVRMAVQLLHDLGTVQYFDNDFLRDYVVINPQWIVNVMACVVSAQDSPIQTNHGRFLHEDIPVVWKEYDADLHEWLLRLTEDFDLTFPLPKEPVNIVPCLLPDEPPDDLVWPSIRDQEGIRETKMVYRFTYLPSGLFNRAQVRLFQFSDGKMVWKKGSLLSKNKHLALIKQTDNKELVVYVQGPRPENILFLIHEVFESIIEESFNGVSYDLFLPCPDCILKEGTTEPDLLNAKLIQRAKDIKAPFIQCYKYFHWISMAQLQENMPSDSREVADFDFQLQQSVVALEELNNSLVVDTAIIYSMADVPKDDETEKLAPALIRDDILGWGYSCWFSNDMNTVDVVEMTSAIKNCKILLALVSDDFERDSKCRDMFLHAREVMNKDIIVVVLGESMEWQNKDLGMKIGTQERKLMAKTKNRYVVDGGRRGELKEWLDEKLHTHHQETMLPDVFVSYAWSNSLTAAQKSGKVHSDSIGWGDPRQLKGVLENNGISCWIDTEFVGKEKKGIFADMANGIRNSKVMLAFISDEYAESDNCMMELRFGIINMELPLIAAVVGTKSGWKYSEVAMLLRRARADEVFLQKENEGGVNSLIKFVQEALKKAKLQPNKKVPELEAKDILKENSKKNKDSSTIAYQEEFELIQRRFMRHIIGAILAVDTMPLPRLIVVDFVKSNLYFISGPKKDDNRTESSLRRSTGGSSRKSLRPKSATKSRDRLQVDESVFEDEEDWSNESLCIKLLCEHEAGWHLCTQMYPLAFRNRDSMEQFLSKSAPYLYRIYTILRQSPIKLKCFSEGKGSAYQKWIRAVRYKIFFSIVFFFLVVCTFDFEYGFIGGCFFSFLVELGMSTQIMVILRQPAHLTWLS